MRRATSRSPSRVSSGALPIHRMYARSGLSPASGPGSRLRVVAAFRAIVLLVRELNPLTRIPEQLLGPSMKPFCSTDDSPTNAPHHGPWRSTVCNFADYRVVTHRWSASRQGPVPAQHELQLPARIVAIHHHSAAPAEMLSCQGNRTRPHSSGPVRQHRVVGGQIVDLRRQRRSVAAGCPVDE